MQVYHLDRESFLNNLRTGIVSDRDQAIAANRNWIEGRYHLVAVIDGKELDDAFVLTNTGHQPWWQNDRVTKRFAEDGCRSTSVGDIIERDGRHYLVCNVGFVEVFVPEVFIPE